MVFTNNGFRYYWDFLGLDTDLIKACWDITGNSQSFPSAIWTTGVSGNYNQIVSGNYTGLSLGANSFIEAVPSNIFFASEEYTCFFLTEKTKTGTCSFLSNNIDVSGFTFGINSAHKLFFKYYNSVDGPEIFTFEPIIPSESIVILTKDVGNIQIGYFNPNTKNIESATYQIPFLNFVNINSGLRIGGDTNDNTFQNSQFLSDSFILKSFIYVDAALSNYQKEILCSGFYNEKLPTGIEIDTVCQNITFLSGETYPAFTGITGFQPILINSFVDVCDNLIEIYNWSGVTGIISGDRFVPVQVEECFEVTGFVDSGFSLDQNYLNSLGMENISIFFTKDNEDYLDGYVMSGLNSYLKHNKIGSFNNATSRFFLDNSYEVKDLAVFLNGQIMLESGFSAFNSGYSVVYQLTGDFIITGTQLQSSNFFNFNDNIIYDVIDKNINSMFFTGHISGQVLPNIDFTNNNVYLNGQKLIKNIHYTEPNILLLDVDFGNNRVTIISKTGIYFSNVSGWSNVGKFLRNSSKVYLNGIRLQIGKDYVESSKLDLLTGNFYIENYNNFIYNNTEDFFNI